MNKKELRKEYFRRRMALSEAEFNELNDALCNTFFSNVPMNEIGVIHTFLPIEKNREVDTWCIIDRLQKEHPHVRIAVPRIDNQNAALEHYFFEDREQLKTNTWGIPEPVKGVPAAIESIDAVLVPLLAFDKQGHRLGYGRGFYDRFLSGCKPGCKKIGLSFFEVEERIDDISEKDIPLDIIVTPKSVYTT